MHQTTAAVSIFAQCEQSAFTHSKTARAKCWWRREVLFKGRIAQQVYNRGVRRRPTERTLQFLDLGKQLRCYDHDDV